jgi:hypothetical protein
MRKLITPIILLCFVSGTSMEAQNVAPVKALNTHSNRGLSHSAGIQKPKGVVLHAPKIKAPLRAASGYELIDSTYNWISTAFLPVWGSPANKYIDYVYDANLITSYVEDTLESGTWISKNKYFFSFNSYDSVATYVVQTWSGSAWVNYDSTTYTYNSNRMITRQLDERWSGSAWVNHDQFIDGYIAAGYADTNEYQTWVSGAWSDSTLETWSYNINNQLLTNVYDTGYLNNWTPEWQYTYAYNSSSNQTIDEFENYVSGAWVYESETVTSYNSNNLQDSVLYLIGGGGSTWVNSGLDLYTYNVYNQQIIEIAQDWMTSAWVTEEEFTYTYATTMAPSSEPATEIYQYGNPLTNLDEQVYTYNIFGDDSTYLDLDWSGTAFDSSSRSFSYYNSNNLETANLGQTYTGGVWVDDDSTTYTYNSHNKPLLQLNQYWSSGAWVNNYEYVYTYNTSDSETSYVYATAGGTGNWETQGYDTWEYDADNFLLAYSIGQDENRNDSTRYYLNAASGIKSISGAVSNILIYPNPSQGTFTIQSSVVSGQLSVEVYNMLGEYIYQTEITNFNYTASLNLDAPNGVYFIRVISEKQGVVMNDKIVIQK